MGQRPDQGTKTPFYSYEEFQKPNQAQWWKNQGAQNPQVGGDPRPASPGRGSGRDSYFGWLGNVGYRNMRGDQPSWFQSYEDWSRPGQAKWLKQRHGDDRSAYGRWLAGKNRGAF